ncbi:hypothetical protein [Rhodobacter capsulatus]|jgi:hypothetical protein|uniref:Uncharacterized protein n=1 Tax=Rhodobacter capsulatus (strain ATCC BAA-309 / NBRC 16581 / SB1003) TaxID=272942 RepID=D5AQQ8_RHOCB|nr:hypothetical protein [Rhodobacter capsulatus]ADE84714.1 conserved hypothetical protein [Rhodobacter capsulatus SB 1003]MDS0926462.1 hypothetical protein [Rhodobacter capsulatus]
MAFVARNFYSILETSFRWECSQTEIVELAMAEKIDLVIALPNVRFDDGTEARMGVIEGGAVRPLFRGYGLLEEHVFIRQARPANCGWKRIEEPKGGIRVMAPDVLITAAEVERFEDENNLVRRVVSGPGAQSRYDWDGFYCEIICRMHNNGLPEKQKELIEEMFNWFLGKSVNGDAPDESTIRKKIRGFWGRLCPD